MITTKIELRSDSVTISGYVNAVGRESRPISSPTGKFVEQVEPGAFKTALTRATNVDLLLNHRTEKKLGSTATGELKLDEDNIGLRAEAVIHDAEVIEKARKGELRGWSFGMYVNKAEIEQRAEKVPKRLLHDIDIFEVSIIDTSCLPVYAGTSVECRAESDVMAETRSSDEEVETVNKIPPDLSEYEKRAVEIAVVPYESRLAELRYNPYHDATNGRFTGSGGSGGAVLHVGKGEKGKGTYVIASENFSSSYGGGYTDSKIMEELPNKLDTLKELPELVGTEKQIKWAKDIRKEVGMELARYAVDRNTEGNPVSRDHFTNLGKGKEAMLSEIQNNALVKMTKGEVQGQRIKDRIGTYNEISRRYNTYKEIMSNDSAKFWIDNRPGSSPETYMNKKFKKKIDGIT